MYWTGVRAIALIHVALLMTASAGAQTSVSPDERREIPIDQPVALTVAKESFLQLRVVTGQIEVTRAPGADVVITAVRDAGATEPRFDLIKDEKGLTLCTVYTSPNPKKPNECLPKGKGRLNEGIKKNSPKVRLRVAMPDGVLFIARMNLGDISAKAGASDLDLKTDFGNISIADNGSRSIWATIVTKGDLTAHVSPVYHKYDRTIRLACNFGRMRVYVDEQLPIEYEISSYHSIETPFRLAKPETMMRKGRLGPDRTSLPPYLTLNLDVTALLAFLELQPLDTR